MRRAAAIEIARDLCLILENDEGTNTQLLEAVYKGILDGSGYADPQDALSAYRDRRDEFVETAGLYLRDELWDMLGLSWKGHDEMTLTEQLFSQVVNYGDGELWREMADTYMPSHDDLATWIEEREE